MKNSSLTSVFKINSFDECVLLFRTINLFHRQNVAGRLVGFSMENEVVHTFDTLFIRIPLFSMFQQEMTSIYSRLHSSTHELVSGFNAWDYGRIWYTVQGELH